MKLRYERGALADLDEIFAYTNGASFSSVMPAHSRPKDGVASLAYVARIHVLLSQLHQRRGWPGRARP